MINILISGANGKMGKKVKEAAFSFDNVKVVCGVDLIENFDNKDFPIYSNFNNVKEKIDVIIDFSAPSNLDNILNYISGKDIKAVLCATGYTDEMVAKIKNASKKNAIFRSSNMSLGVNVLIDVVKSACKNLYGFDIEIIEKHHNQKKDAPSGTALMLADAIKQENKEKFYTYGREGIVGARDKNEIGIHAIRGGNIVGEHQVIFAGNDETLTFTHQATDRGVFANGAIKASMYISNKNNGLFDMSDMISGK